MGQFGGGKMGGPALSSNTTIPQDFRNCPPGPVKRFDLEILFSLVSTAASFDLAVSTGSGAAAEGSATTGDDVDRVLTSIFPQITYYWDPQTMAFALAPAVLRTLLGYFNPRDFGGNFTNGTAVAATGNTPTAFRITIPLPVELKGLFHDGDIFRNGSERLKTGQILWQTGNLTGNVTMTNGTGTLSAVSVNVYAVAGAGSAGDVGNVWRAQIKSNLPTFYSFDQQLRLLMLDRTPASTNAATAIDVGPHSLVTPANLQDIWQSDWLNGTSGKYDITARGTPLVTIGQHRTLADFQAELGRVLSMNYVGGVSSVNVLDVQVVPADSTATLNAAIQVGGGGAVDIQHPSPTSLPPGSKVSPALAHLLPQRITPGGTASGSGGVASASSPVAAAGATAQRLQVGAAAGAILDRFRPRR